MKGNKISKDDIYLSDLKLILALVALGVLLAVLCAICGFDKIGPYLVSICFLSIPYGRLKLFRKKMQDISLIADYDFNWHKNKEYELKIFFYLSIPLILLAIIGSFVPIPFLR